MIFDPRRKCNMNLVHQQPYKKMLNKCVFKALLFKVIIFFLVFFFIWFIYVIYYFENLFISIYLLQNINFKSYFLIIKIEIN